MSRPQASALVHSVQARLKNAAREGGRPFAEVLELYAFRDIDLLGPVDLGQERLRGPLGDLLRLAVEDDGIEFSLHSIGQPILDAARDRPFQQRWPKRGPWCKEGGTSDA